MPELGVPPGIISAQPRIRVDGQDRPELAAGLLSLLVEETTAGLYRCEARFANWGAGAPDTAAPAGYLYFDRQIFDFGKEIAVTAGADEGEIFRGRISALEAQYGSNSEPSLVVLAEDRGQDLRTVRRTRIFENMTDADAIRQIASDHGLQAQVGADGPTHAVLAQINQSDLAFTRERARWLDAEVWLEDRTLHVQARGRRMQGAEPLTLRLGHGLLEFTASADLARQHTIVVVSGWDVSAKQRISFTADAGVLGSELAGDRSGASLLQSAFGEQVDRIVHEGPVTSAEAQGLAEAAFRAQARRFVTGAGVARGDARLRVGAQVRLEGLGRMFDGVYYVSEARHVFARRAGGGYAVEFVVERPGIGG